RAAIVFCATHHLPVSFSTITAAASRGSAVRRIFYQLSRQIGLRGPEDHKGPRLHDFRHRFAVRTLVEWYRSNEDIERRLPVLSTFLGHGHVGQIPTGIFPLSRN